MVCQLFVAVLFFCCVLLCRVWRHINNIVEGHTHIRSDKEMKNWSHYYNYRQKIRSLALLLLFFHWFFSCDHFFLFLFSSFSFSRFRRRSRFEQIIIMIIFLSLVYRFYLFNFELWLGNTNFIHTRIHREIFAAKFLCLVRRRTRNSKFLRDFPMAIYLNKQLLETTRHFEAV